MSAWLHPPRRRRDPDALTLRDALLTAAVVAVCTSAIVMVAHKALGQAAFDAATHTACEDRK